jgi:hypothetical protein
MTSPSSKFRSIGNQIFLSLEENQENFPALIIESRLKDCLANYFKALNEAKDDKERSSACKNITSTTYRLLKFYAYRRNDKKMCDFYIYECQKYASDALEFGSNRQTQVWHSKVKSIAQEAFEKYVDYIKDNDFESKIERLLKLILVSPLHIKLLINYLLSECNFKKSISLSDDNAINVRNSLNINKECDYYIEECNRLLPQVTNSDKFIEQLIHLKEEINKRRCLLEGLNSKYVAQDLLAKCTHNETITDFDALLEVIDWYKDALMKIHDQNLEMEAEIYSELGHIYDYFLKQKDRAKSYYQQCIHLVDSLGQIQSFMLKHKWFQICLESIKQYQIKVIEEENSSYEAKREKVMHIIEDDLDYIRRKAQDGAYKFLEFIYKAFPPKDSKYRLNQPVTSHNIRKCLQKAITHYHPDRNSIDEYGTEWHFTADEITKNLTKFYELIKLTD